MQKGAMYPVQGNVALVDAALKKNIRKFVLMSSLLTNGKEAGQSLNPGTISFEPFPLWRRVCDIVNVSQETTKMFNSLLLSGCDLLNSHAGYIFLNLFGNVLNEKLVVRVLDIFLLHS